MTAEAMRLDLKPGQIVAVNGKIYGCCAECKEIVRVDKWLLGSLHLCTPAKEKGGV